MPTRGRGRSAMREANERDKALKASKMALSRARATAEREEHLRHLEAREAFHAEQRLKVRRKYGLE